MGKPTAAQKLRQVKAVEPEENPEQGVYVLRSRELEKPEEERKLMVFKGNFDCQMTPAGALVIVELVPDMANINKGQPIPKIRQFIADGQWAEVVVK